MKTFTNNLRKGDTVEDSASGRRGVVQMNPREVSTRVSVLMDGAKAQRYMAVLALRLVVDGQAEAVPPVTFMEERPLPVDGAPRAQSVRSAFRCPPLPDSAEILRLKADAEKLASANGILVDTMRRVSLLFSDMKARLREVLS